MKNIPVPKPGDVHCPPAPSHSLLSAFTEIKSKNDASFPKVKLVTEQRTTCFSSKSLYGSDMQAARVSEP